MIDVPEPDGEAEQAARAAVGPTGPAGGLGRLTELASWVAGRQGRWPSRPFRRIRVVVFGAEQDPAGVAGGAGPVNVLARAVAAGVRIVDPGATGRSAEEATRAFATGGAVADEEVDSGADLLVPGVLGAGHATACAALVAVLTGAEPVQVTRRGDGIDDRAWMRAVAAVRDATRRARPAAGDPLALLASAGEPDLAALTGFLVQAAVRRTAVVLDGAASLACALLAEELAPGAAGWQLAGSRSADPAQRLALDRLGHEPLLDLALVRDDGTGALLAVPLLQAAAAVLADAAGPGAAARG